MSVIDQQYSNLEVFVIDGGSTDNSVDIIKKYENKLAYWISEKDNGQSDAINKGFAKATGDIVSWLCSDDLYTAGTLTKVATQFSTASQNQGLIHGGVILFNEKKELEKRFNYLTPSIESYLGGIVFSQPAAFYKEDSWNKQDFFTKIFITGWILIFLCACLWYVNSFQAMKYSPGTGCIHKVNRFTLLSSNLSICNTLTTGRATKSTPAECKIEKCYF